MVLFRGKYTNNFNKTIIYIRWLYILFTINDLTI